jgi:hypothetical protein
VVVCGGRGGGVDSAAIAAEDAGKRVGNMKLIRVEECYLNIESRHNFGIEYIYIFKFVNTNLFLDNHLQFKFSISMILGMISMVSGGEYEWWWWGWRVGGEGRQIQR